MTIDKIPAPLAEALAAKGYDSLTPVQDAVLAPEAQGRNLLVSAQTGSGKTVAFGLAMAPDLLVGRDRLPPADRPLALAIAPTRELALQVARELEWLYGVAAGRVATCVGGMDYRSERRGLERGPQIVVGTPGRLRDHLERGALDLSALHVAVLDEADEMLDMGFREDLEALLSAAPAERRTLMFSATVPPAIETLARDFQRDALRIVTQGEARQHGDIAYRALTVTPRDREPAIFNLLRLHEARTAIVFCKTRANVNHLLARMGNRGFKVVALSGELSQQERGHALQALRDGRARVCIATDVAARGIDLPGLELVIHADLPTNAETLLHRSGRTGRAGAKGTSALIVTPADRSKAQRLLKWAKVEAEWAPAPSADEVRAEDDKRMMDHPALQAAPEDEAPLAAALLERFGAEQMATAFIRLWREGQPPPEEVTAVRSSAPEAPRAPRERADFADAPWFAIGVGHTGRAEARWLLPKICEAGGIGRDSIGAIRVQRDETYVQIAPEMADRFGESTLLDRDLPMRRIDYVPDLGAPGAGPGKPRRGTGPNTGPKKARFDHAPRTRTEAPERPARPAPHSAPHFAPRAAEETPVEEAPRRPKKPRWTTEERVEKGHAPTRSSKSAKGHEGKAGWAKPRAERDPSAKPYGKGPGKGPGKPGAKFAGPKPGFKGKAGFKGKIGAKGGTPGFKGKPGPKG